MFIIMASVELKRRRKKERKKKRMEEKDLIDIYSEMRLLIQNDQNERGMCIVRRLRFYTLK